MLQLFWFSLPSIAASLLEPLAGVVDTAFVGRLDTSMLAALAVGTTVLSSFTWIFNFLIHASTQSIASSSQSEIGGRVRIGLSVAIVVGIFSSIFLYLLRAPLYELIAQSGVSKDLIDEYFLVRLWGHPFAILYMTALSMLRGLSRVNLALVFVLVTTILNIFFSWLFLYPFQLGLSGAAYGTVVANIIGMLVSLYILIGDERIKTTIRQLPPSSEWFSFGKNSLNLFGRSLAITGSLFLGSRYAAQSGETSLAAHQILLQVWLFASFFIDGVAITANIKGAEYVQLKQRKSLQNVIQATLLLGLIIGFIFALAYFFAGSFIQEIFTKDQSVIALLKELWPWIALTQITNALAFVYDGILFGLGAIGGFVWVRRWMLVAAICFFLPIASLGDGLMAVWLGLIAMNLFRLISGWWTTRTLVRIVPA